MANINIKQGIAYTWGSTPEERLMSFPCDRAPPSKFVFAIKGSRYLTHMKKLKDPIEPLSRLLERASGLEEKLDPILFQFPLCRICIVHTICYSICANLY
ncbi:hypothetical protein NIES4075_33770 [Tolypothrix sp. NIES-4075]|uniref:DUF72 domain-containing protein n=1 Tax=Tolypothrix sp. NIES-4075 TaxID=2005459 RepID=UPI000B720703|nr:DUF72 domain-containing protein [Tolypothrix sp. NIES-4075]GAX42376.1 hypothetical protein NIES4075_33770 [Tolypothrix sp. NIES-4075]